MQEAGELDSENGAAAAAKKKLPKVEENKSKKEHVNVVFIGHVGKLNMNCATAAETVHLARRHGECVMCNK